jgi:hypothetical protein
MRNLNIRVWRSGFSPSALLLRGFLLSLHSAFRAPRSAFILSLFFAFCAFTSPAAVQQAWVAKYNFGPASTNQAVAIALDFNGNIIVAGHAVGGASGYDYVLLKYSPNGSQLWVRTYTTPGNFDDQIRGMKVDAAGNIFVTGTSETLMYSADGTLLWNQPYAGRALAVDDGHIYLTGFSNSIFATAKLSNINGSNVWLKTFNIVGVGRPSEVIAVNQNSNVFVAGANFCFYDPRGVWYVNMYVLAYGPDGNALWTRELVPGCQLSGWNIRALATDPDGSVYVMGNLYGLGIAESYFTTKLDSEGKVLWQYSLEYQFYDAARAMVLDSRGFLYLTGASGHYNSSQFGTAKLTADSGTNTSPTNVWQRQYGGPGRDEAGGLALDNQGNVYVTGRFASASSAYDFATVKYDADGNERWVKPFNGPANLNDEPAAIAVSPSGDVYVTGFSTTASNLIEITTIKYIQVSPIEKKSNGNILLTFPGAPGSNYLIEACSTLTNWTNIGSATADANGLYTFEDTNAPLHQQRFYRALAE